LLDGLVFDDITIEMLEDNSRFLDLNIEVLNTHFNYGKRLNW
jgi:hypothetical protein